MNLIKKLWDKLLLGLFGSGFIAKVVEKLMLVLAGVLSQIPGLAPDVIEKFLGGFAQLLIALVPIFIAWAGKHVAKKKE